MCCSGESKECCGAKGKGCCGEGKKCSGGSLSCYLKKLVVFLVTGFAGLGIINLINLATSKLCPEHEAEMQALSGMFRPMDHPVWLYMFIHPFYMALLVMCGMRHLCCPGKVTLLWGFVTLPGIIMTGYFNIPFCMVASWFIGSILLVFGEAVVVALIRSVLCGGGGCCGSKGKKEEKKD